MVVYTVPPATVTEEALGGVSMERTWLRRALEDLDGRLYIGSSDMTAHRGCLAAAVEHCIRMHAKTLVKSPKSPPAAGKTLSFNATVAATRSSNPINVMDWHGVECSTLAPSFIADSGDISLISDWKVRSEASSMRLRRGRGRVDKPVVSTARPSDQPPLDWWYVKDTLPGLFNHVWPGGKKTGGAMPDTTWWLLAAAHNELWLTVTGRQAYDAPHEPMSNLPILEMAKIGEKSFQNHRLQRELTYVLRTLMNARQYHWVSIRSRFSPVQPPVTARPRYAALRHALGLKRARAKVKRVRLADIKLKCSHVDDYISWFRQRVPDVFKWGTDRFFGALHGWPVVSALDDDPKRLLPATLACYEERVNGHKRKGGNEMADGDGTADGADESDGGGEEEVGDGTADGADESDGVIVARRPPSTRKRRRPGYVDKNNASWEVDAWFSTPKKM